MKERKVGDYSSIVYDFYLDSITHVKIGSKWISVEDLAVKNLIPAEVLRKGLTLQLYRRLKEKVDKLPTEETMFKFKLEREKVLKVLAKHVEWDEEELKAFITVLFRGHEEIDSIQALSILAEKTNIPFHVFVKEVLREF
ncbi:hypothetical protein J7L06_00670 [Candidatus Bathyarchaeota archaeon]|nr:hypothetical protein [Candidatus Bathyarchaeota archaeon]